jgi:CHAD domain-containing protein
MVLGGQWRTRHKSAADRSCRVILPVIIQNSLDNLWQHGDLETIFRKSCDYHRFRKDLKKLRYILDMVRSLYPKAETAPWRKVIKRLQDALGTVNDLDEARMQGYEQFVSPGNYGVQRHGAVDLSISLSQTLALLPRFY